MNSTLFDFSPLYEYKVDDMLNNIKIIDNKDKIFQV